MGKTPHCFPDMQREDFPTSGQLGLTLFNPWATWSAPPAAQLTGIIPDNKGHGGHLCVCSSLSRGLWHVCSGCWWCKCWWHGCFGGELCNPCSFGYGSWLHPLFVCIKFKAVTSEVNRQGWAEWREDRLLSLRNDLLKRDTIPAPVSHSGGWCHHNISMLGSTWGLPRLPWAHQLPTRRFCLVTVTPGRG